MLELQFKNLHANVVSKPRSSSYIIELSLGALYLKDTFTPNTIFSVLVGPPGQDRTPTMKTKGSSPRLNIIGNSEDLFYMKYEKCPSNCRCDYK